ncbi:MAG: acylphosphatase [bacterium]|nr:acylphosphatase [bacterium]
MAFEGNASEVARRTQRRVHVFVSGRVQGVFYRGSTEREARRLGVTGWVRNLPDGRVEVLIEGLAGAVEEALGFVRRGSQFSRVDRVEVVEEIPQDEFSDFSVWN